MVCVFLFARWGLFFVVVRCVACVVVCCLLFDVCRRLLYEVSCVLLFVRLALFVSCVFIVCCVPFVFERCSVFVGV